MSTTQVKSFSYANYDPETISYEHILKTFMEYGTPVEKSQFNMLNATIDSAPMMLQKRYLTGEGKGGVFDEPDYSRVDKSNPSAKPPRRILPYPQDTRDKANYAAMLTPRLPKSIVSTSPDVAENIRKEQYKYLLKKRLAFEIVWRSVFTQESGCFGDRVRLHKKEAQNYYREMHNMSPEEFSAKCSEDSDLQKKITERAFAKFLGSATKTVLDPRLYNWDTLEDVTIKNPDDVIPGTTKKFPKTYSIFSEWYVWNGIFDKSTGKMRPKPSKKNMVTPDYETLPSNEENFVEIVTKMTQDNHKLNYINWYDENSVKIERPMRTFPAKGDIGEMTIPDPWWCPIDFTKEECMVTVRSTLKIMQSARRQDTFGVSENFSSMIIISYRAKRPESEEWAARSQPDLPQSNKSLFASIPSVAEESKKRSADAIEGPPAPSSSNAKLFKAE